MTDPYPLCSPDDDLSDFTKRLEKHGYATKSVIRQFPSSQQETTTCQLAFDPEVLQEYDDVMTALSSTDPYNVTVKPPGTLGSQNFDHLPLQGRSTVLLTDAESKFPTSSDVVMLTKHEATQSRVMAQMAEFQTHTAFAIGNHVF